MYQTNNHTAAVWGQTETTVKNTKKKKKQPYSSCMGSDQENCKKYQTNNHTAAVWDQTKKTVKGTEQTSIQQLHGIIPR